MNLKDLTSVRAFPVDADGFAVVPMRGFKSLPEDVQRTHTTSQAMRGEPVARIFPILLPGPYCLVGYDADGDISSWNENGEVNPLLPFDIVMSADEVQMNSLQTPPSIEKVEYIVTYIDVHGDEVPFDRTFETEAEARGYADEDDERVYRKTETVFSLPNGLAGEVKVEQIAGPVALEDADLI